MKRKINSKRPTITYSQENRQLICTLGRYVLRYEISQGCPAESIDEFIRTLDAGAYRTSRVPDIDETKIIRYCFKKIEASPLKKIRLYG